LKKLKEIWNGEHRSFVRYAVYATAVFFIYIGFLGEDNLIRWIRAGIELGSQKRQIEIYKRQIETMDEKIRLISTDKDTLERFAIENFNFARQGDDVYIDKP
jgi:hypothetical protein